MPGKRVANGTGLRWLKAAMAEDTDECQPWPFCKSRGYGMLQLEGRKMVATRYVVAHCHGPSPSPKHEAAHSCDNPACINKRHLRWATSRENSLDAVRRRRTPRGERHPRAKLTQADVDRIRARTETARELSENLGVTMNTIYDIRTGKSWNSPGKEARR